MYAVSVALPARASVRSCDNSVARLIVSSEGLGGQVAGREQPLEKQAAVALTGIVFNEVFFPVDDINSTVLDRICVGIGAQASGSVVKLELDAF